MASRRLRSELSPSSSVASTSEFVLPSGSMASRSAMGIAEVRQKVAAVEQEIVEVKQNIAKANQEIAETNQEIAEVKDEIADIKQKIENCTDYDTKKELQHQLSQLQHQFSQLQHQFGQRLESLNHKEEYLVQSKKILQQREQYSIKLMQQESPPPRKKQKKQKKGLSCSPSEFALKAEFERDNLIKTTTVSPYQHWFALEAYNCFHSLKCKGESIPVNNTLVSPSKDQLDNFMHNIMFIVEPTQATRGYRRQHDLLNCEVVMTAQLAREFDHFLFHKESQGGCYHQIGSRLNHQQPERPDIYVLSKTKNKELSMPILIGDFKTDKFKLACSETIAYVTTCLQNTSLDQYTLILGLPMTCDKVQLLVCIDHPDGVIFMEVCEAAIKNDDTLKAFFHTVYCCVHSLIQNPIEISKFPCFTSSHDAEHTLSSRVLHFAGKVHKYYDSKLLCAKPNLDFIVSLKQYALPQVKCCKLSENERFQKLEYEYVEGSHEPRSIQQVAMIIAILGKIHSQNYVHSDIREGNLLFKKDGRTAYIIDFDLVDKVDEPYPSTYNHSLIPERHSGAKADLPRKKIHDRHSLFVVLSRFQLTPDQQQHLKMLEDEQKELSTISKFLSKSM